jgi:hypothetical protein
MNAVLIIHSRTIRPSPWIWLLSVNIKIYTNVKEKGKVIPATGCGGT